ncbi:bifunctional diguanylate cyclase/phosphodiesterase [Planktothrix paucivesiculata]|uniref:Diguanylate cyclase n=1 Tax=Planktothrix paucivesiculata PCC 9631 TaxID=671071 RepID=A0A7Z9BEQ4_9CYAN|nr:EAL domain-containing protein [Planktothrix paucivesiculata]VXD10476.1 putative Diguanylate cyclase [Planktothrix paucivesiculata PCC 9631]
MLTPHNSRFLAKNRVFRVDDQSSFVKQTEAELQQQKLDFQVVNRALAVLSACTQAVIRATDEITLLQTLCELITQEAAYRMAWVAYVCHDQVKSVKAMAWAGYEADYLETLNITWADTERGRGPTGQVIRSGHPVACQNMLNDPNFAPWREAAQQRGYQSSLVLPMFNNGEVFGTLNIYSAEAYAFNPKEVELLTQLTDSLSFGIIALRAEQSLRESEQRYRLLAENISDLVCLHDRDRRYLYLSPSCESLLGYGYDELIGKDPYILFHPDDRDRISEEFRAAILGKNNISITYRISQKSGNYIWLETLTKPILNEAGKVVQIQTTSRDITERILVRERFKYEALHDTLTGLPNRNLLMERLKLGINRIHNFEGYHFALLFLDLDRFKVINDSLGHLVGDQLLIAVAHKFQSILRSTDLVTRMGGDEFVILLDEIKDIQEAIRAIENIFQALACPLIVEEREIHISTSIGIVFGTKDYIRAEDLLRDADIAMYRAKKKGKARYEIFDREMHAIAINRLHLENDLRGAIKKQQFLVYYQPIIDIFNHRLIGFEALVRWQHPTRGFISPAEFIPLAEETNLIVAIDSWMLSTACQQLATWNKKFPSCQPLKMSINLSAQDFRKVNLIEEIDTILRETGLEGNTITLEITESMLIEDINKTIDLLTKIKSRNIQISIDDFGTGYSSLNYLHRFPIDNLKIDYSFVSQMQEKNRNYQVVSSIIDLGHHLDLVIVAEGIETAQQMQWLRAMGCELGQGYLFSKPLSPQEIEIKFLK